MGNIVTPDQGLLPLPAYALATTPYPWWLTAALAIWALLALLCCWLLLLLYLLRYCCRWWRQRKYAADRKSIRERLFRRGGGAAAAGRADVYATQEQHFATAPLPPVPPYAVSGGNSFEREIVEDEFYGNRMGYGTAGAAGAENRAFGADSESFSEEEIIQGKNGGRTSRLAGGLGSGAFFEEEVIQGRNGGRAGGLGSETVIEEEIIQGRNGGRGGRQAVSIMGSRPASRAGGLGSETVVEEEIMQGDNGGRESRQAVAIIGGRPASRAGGVTENIETNVERNITKNYYINEEQNYFVQNEPAVQHDQVIQSLPPPTVTTINMAAERIADNPNWENTNAKEDFNNQPTNQASAGIVATDPSLFRQDVRYERPPDVYTHRPVTPEPPRIENRTLAAEPMFLSDDGSITSEMSGHDSESIYETIRVLKPKAQVVSSTEDEEKDDYRTAGVDEVEIEIKDLVRLQKTNPRSATTYDDIVTSSNMSRQRLKPRASSSLSSSSTLNNLMTNQSQPNNRRVAEEQKEETVTETITTEQVQTTYHQIGQNLDGSAFFIPLTHEESEQNDEKKIIIPVTTSSIRYEEQPALQQF